MIINHEKKLVFIHIPKCAGKFVRKIINEKDPKGYFWDWKYNEKLNSWLDMAHIPLHQLYHFEEWKLLSEYKTIAVIRDPIDRFFSSLSEHNKQHNRLRSVSQILNELDPIKIAYDPRYVHFCPQTYFTHYNGKCIVDHFLYQEELNTSLMGVADALNLNKNLILKSEDSRKFKNKVKISKRDLNRLYNLYRSDFELLGYEIPKSISTDEQISFSFRNKCFKNYLYNPPNQYRVSFAYKVTRQFKTVLRKFW